MNLNNLSVLDNLKSRSISPENFTGEKGHYLYYNFRNQ